MQWDGTTGTLTIGSTNATITVPAPTNANGNNIQISATSGVGTNKAGGQMTVTAGDATGTANAGSIVFTAGSNLGVIGGNAGNIVFNAGMSGGGAEGVVQMTNDFGVLAFGQDIDLVTPLNGFTLRTNSPAGGTTTTIKSYNNINTDTFNSEFWAENFFGNAIIMGYTSHVNTSSPLTGGPNGEQGYLYETGGNPICFGTNATLAMCIAGSDQGITVGSATDHGAGTLTALNGLYSGATQIKPVLTGVSGSIGGGALVAGACASGTVSIAGLTATGMDVHATPNTYPGDGFWWEAYGSGSNQATVKVCAAVAGTPTASTYTVRVLQ